MVSCAPDRFTLNKRIGANLIGCKILSDIDNVKKTGDNSVLILPNGILAMKVLGMTQHESDFTVNLLKGNGIKFAYRTVEHNRDIHSSLIIHLTNDKIAITDQSGSLIAENNNYGLSVNTKYRFRVVNKGKNLKIYLDCDEVLNVSTKIPATEYILIETINDTKAELSGIDIQEAFFY